MFVTTVNIITTVITVIIALLSLVLKLSLPWGNFLVKVYNCPKFTKLFRAKQDNIKNCFFLGKIPSAFLQWSVPWVQQDVIMDKYKYSLSRSVQEDPGPVLGCSQWGGSGPVSRMSLRRAIGQISMHQDFWHTA